MTVNPGFAAAGFDQDDSARLGADDLRRDASRLLPACRAARRHGHEPHRGEPGFPTFPRFCGQTFLEQPDRDARLACVQAYNDWMIDEWCGGDGYGRLIPLTIVPLWDPELAAAEVRRCADKGSHAMAFSENPARLEAAEHLHRPLGPVVRRVRTRRTRWSTCTSVRRRRSR